MDRCAEGRRTAALKDEGARTNAPEELSKDEGVRTNAPEELSKDNRAMP